jgi:hypothetical protein
MQRVVVDFAETAENMRDKKPSEVVRVLNELILHFADIGRKKQNGQPQPLRRRSISRRVCSS